MKHQAYIEEGLLGYTQVLERQGPAGLDFLNARVEHRFTGVYQLVAGVMHNVYLHDKQGEIIPEFLKAVPLGDSFCQFVLRDGLFCTVNSGLDQRLQGHKYQGVIGAYYGVPLLNNAGELYGTLCHFEEPNHALPDAEFAFLQKAALLLPKYLFGRTPTLLL
ncbi:MAG: GAF domain-containing protein [Comamonas sp.]|nr:GAF domain-containing protein [Candidatus Comamonas equi]